MTATYVGSQYNEWEMEGRKGVYTDIHLVKPFPLGFQNTIGDRAVTERVRADIREKIKDLVPGCPVELAYDSGAGGKAVLVDIKEAK